MVNQSPLPGMCDEDTAASGQYDPISVWRGMAPRKVLHRILHPSVPRPVKIRSQRDRHNPIILCGDLEEVNIDLRGRIVEGVFVNIDKPTFSDFWQEGLDGKVDHK